MFWGKEKKSDECYLPDLLLNRDCGAGMGRETRNCRVNQYWAGNVGWDPLSKSRAEFVCLVFLISYCTYSRRSCYHSCCCLYVILAFFPSSYFAIWAKIQLKAHLFPMVLTPDRWGLSIEAIPGPWQVRGFSNDHAKYATRLISS